MVPRRGVKFSASLSNAEAFGVGCERVDRHQQKPDLSNKLLYPALAKEHYRCSTSSAAPKPRVFHKYHRMYRRRHYPRLARGAHCWAKLWTADKPDRRYYIRRCSGTPSRIAPVESPPKTSAFVCRSAEGQLRSSRMVMRPRSATNAAFNPTAIATAKDLSPVTPEKTMSSVAAEPLEPDPQQIRVG